MPMLKFKRFAKPQFLRALRRDLLEAFLASFAPDLAAAGVKPPDPRLSPEEYCCAWSALLLAPETLPDRFNETLFALDELATDEGMERLAAGAAAAGLDWSDDSAVTRAEVALRTWLAAPDLVARVHNEQNMGRLTAFEHFGHAPVPIAQPPLTVPGPALLQALTERLDAWFARHHRGRQTTRVEFYPIRGEWWFLVRHGDVLVRTAAVEAQRTEILHFRPEKDDVIVFVPEADELRINARSRGERELYRRAFGACLGQDEDYFADTRTYTLEPLREDGADALDTAGLEGIQKITLREIEVAWDNGDNEVVIRRAADLFACTSPAGRLEAEPIPRGGRLARAAFDVHFCGAARPRLVQVRPPNHLKLGRHCDARLIGRWLARRRFRTGGGQGEA